MNKGSVGEHDYGSVKPDEKATGVGVEGEELADEDVVVAIASSELVIAAQGRGFPRTSPPFPEPAATRTSNGGINTSFTSH
ncbi:hypothetical protein ONZ45_g10058 [Pleurotus djamor]|nr:hypothetical protein ONZ45_g10058 [Pleurotus djamor]